jgi:hypothetical protein
MHFFRKLQIPLAAGVNIYFNGKKRKNYLRMNYTTDES